MPISRDFHGFSVHFAYIPTRKRPQSLKTLDSLKWSGCVLAFIRVG